MKRPKPTWPIRFMIYATAVILLTSFSILGQGLESKPQSPEQQKLAEAQTKYYEAQAAKVNEDRSAWQRLINLSAFLAALVAVLSLVLNYSSTIRTQRDSQFLEALKRFGDKDSPSVRASAAGLLAKLSNQHAVIFRWRRPNFELVLDQLMAGLMLEENSVCVASIIDAVRQLATIRGARVLERVAATNIRIQNDTVRALARFIATVVSDETGAIEVGEHWISAAASTPYNDHVLNTLARRYSDQFGEEFRSALQEYVLLSGKAQSLLKGDRQRTLSLTARRLSVNVELCVELLKSFWALSAKHPFARARLSNAFLAKADLSFAELQKIDLDHAQMQGAYLRYANLTEAQLAHANFQGADLSQAVLRNAFMVGTILEGAALNESELQRAQLVGAQLGSLVLRNPDGGEKKAQTSLEKANLEGANLEWAALPQVLAAGTIFKSANLAHTKLGGMIVKKGNYFKQVASFGNCNWWKANFFLDTPYVIGKEDKNLLDFLFTNYASDVPTDTKEVDSSVRQFMNERQSQKTEVGDT